MNKRFLSLICISIFCCLFSLNLTAQRISPEKARLKAEEFIKERGSLNSGVATIATPALLTLQRTYKKADKDALYAFSKGNQGFILVTAEDIEQPVIGYVDHGIFNPDSLPVGLKWYIEEALKNQADNPLPVLESKQSASRPAIMPLVKTKWNQDWPYNLMCPQYTFQDYTGNAPSGCMATAMAQIMKFYEWPVKPTGSHSYDWLQPNGDASQWNIDNWEVYEDYPYFMKANFSINYDDITFDWDNMLDTYNGGSVTDDQANAVALLMKAVGYSINMNYGYRSSGASHYDIMPAMNEHFGYTNKGQLFYKNSHTLKEIEELAYQELADGAPILWKGTNTMYEDHMFICDGYDGNGYFHFNWGWGGICDGFFSLAALVPSGSGTGGNGSGYDYEQYMIFGLRPDNGEYPDLKVKPSLEVYSAYHQVTDTERLFVLSGVTSTTTEMCEDLKFDIGIEITDPKQSKSYYITDRDNVLYEWYWDDYSYEADDILEFIGSPVNGTYELRPVYKLPGISDEYYSFNFYDKGFEYFELTIDGSSSTLGTKINSNPYNLKIENFKIRGNEFVDGIPTSLSFDFINDSDDSIYDQFVIYMSTPMFEYGEGSEKITTKDFKNFDLNLGLKPHTTQSVSFEAYFYVTTDLEDAKKYNQLIKGQYYMIEIADIFGNTLIRTGYDYPAVAFDQEAIEVIEGIAYFPSSNAAYAMPPTFATPSTRDVNGGDPAYTGDILIPEKVTFKTGETKPVLCNVDYFKTATNLVVNATESWSWIEDNESDNNGSLVTLEISNMPNIPYKAFVGAKNLKSLKIGKGVKTIGESAFGDAEALETLELGEDLEGIDMFAFNRASSLKEVVIPDNVKRLGESVFSSCSSLENLVIGDGVKYIRSSTFTYCYNLKHLKIGDAVTRIENEAFSNCLELEDVHLGKSVASIGDRAFFGCKKLKELNIPESLNSIGIYAFNQCFGLKSLDLSNVTQLGEYAFYDCTSLSDLKLSEELTELPDGAFVGNLVNPFVVPESVIRIGKGNFYRQLSNSGKNESETSIIFINNPGKAQEDIKDAFEFDGVKVKDDVRLYVAAPAWESYDEALPEYEVFAIIEGFEDMEYSLKPGDTVVHEPIITSGIQNTDPVYTAESLDTNVATVNPSTMEISAVSNGTTSIIFTSRQHEELAHTVKVNVSDSSSVGSLEEDGSDYKVYSTKTEIVIDAPVAGETANVYSANGQLLASKKLSAGTNSISIGYKGGPVIVTIASKAWKLSH